MAILQNTVQASSSTSDLSDGKRYLTCQEASLWASQHTGTDVTPANIQYLIKYDRIGFKQVNGVTAVSEDDLKKYFVSKCSIRERAYKTKLGEDINWSLSFEKYKESETTKHVHRLHPYKGKFIPQLVEYFLDKHIDEFKQRVYFHPGQLLLDPFCGSGTTLVQSNELGIHAVGVDVSTFNAMISNLKFSIVDVVGFEEAVHAVSSAISRDYVDSGVSDFEANLAKNLSDFNSTYFPAPEFRSRVRRGEINEKEFGCKKEAEFLSSFHKLLMQYGIETEKPIEAENFLEHWFLPSVFRQLRIARSIIDDIKEPGLGDILRLILSRTARSCRATTHYDLATLINPVVQPYYCSKHSKICRPVFNCLKWWNRYTTDTLRRFVQFNQVRTDAKQVCLTGDSRTIDILGELDRIQNPLNDLLRKQGFKGIFSSPPYVGLIDYHEQHAYAYDLFGYDRNDSLEIGPLSQGQGKLARSSYIKGISDVLVNSRKYLADEFDIFLVANDRFNLYPTIAELADMKVINEFKRPVLNRAEGNKGKFSESIFHLISK